jgi:hypothetical protein
MKLTCNARMPNSRLRSDDVADMGYSANSVVRAWPVLLGMGWVSVDFFAQERPPGFGP